MKYKDLVNISVKKFELLKSKSLVNHQYIKNVHECGDVVEREIRKLFSELLPSRFRVTHGYIANVNSRNEEPLITPQIDMIIVDDFVPSTLYSMGNDDAMEIISSNSVVGVFELKRTLNKKSLLGTKHARGAVQQLNEIIAKGSLTKSNQEKFLPGGIGLGAGFEGGHYSNPIIGIIGLTSTKDMANLDSNNNIVEYLKTIDNYHLDIVTSLGEFNFVPVGEDNNVTLLNYNEKNDLNYTFYPNSKSTEFIISAGIGYILQYINRSCGRQTVLSNFYMNDNLE